MGHTCCVRECEEERRNTDTYRFLGIRNLVESSFHTLFLYNLYYLFYLFIFFFYYFLLFVAYKIPLSLYL